MPASMRSPFYRALQASYKSMALPGIMRWHRTIVSWLAVWRMRGENLVQTAVANNLEPFDYLKYLFTEIPKLGRHYEPEALDQFLPWNLTAIIEPLNQAA